MRVQLSAQAEAFVRQVVIEGKYASADQVIEAAVRFFADELLRRDIALGLKEVREGRISEWNVEEAKQELLRRMKRKKKAS